MIVLDTMLCPSMSQLKEHWFRNVRWCVFTTQLWVASLSIQGAEKLKLVCIFTFWETKSYMMVTIKGKSISHNKWIYDEVVKVLPTNCVAILVKQATECEALLRDYLFNLS